MKFTSTIEINAAPETAFPWIDDPARGKPWAASITGGELLHTTPERVGSTFREVIGKEGHRLEMQGAITEYVANECFAVHLESARHAADVRLTLTRLPRCTGLSREVDLRLKGFMKFASFVLRPMLKKSIQDENQREFATLKRLCETENPS